MPAELDAGTVVLPVPDVVFQDLEEESGGVLLDLRSGGYFSVNPTGRDIFALLDGRSLGAVADAVRKHYPEAEDQDVHEFVAALVEHELATVSEPA